MRSIRNIFGLVLLTVLVAMVFVKTNPLQASGKIKIDSAEELAKIGNDPDYPLDGDYLLTSSSDLRYHNNGNWEPIGDEDNPFTGTFDGDNHWLDHLKINQPGDSHLGLFGYVKAATIENLELRNVDIEGDSYVGALFGKASSEHMYNTIDNFVHNIHVDGNVSGDHEVGGVIGSMSNTNVKNITSDVDVGARYLLGGLAGYAWGSPITSSYSRGDVIATFSSGNTRVGGLVGTFVGGTKATIETSYAVGKIEGNKNVGGLVGQLGSGAGGGGPFIIDTYAAGKITGVENIGGLVGGYSDPSSPPIEASNSYYDKDMIERNDTGEGEGKSTSDMLKETTYDGWDFSSTWGINPGEYPHLRALSDSGPKNPKDIVSIEAIDPIEVEVGTELGDISRPPVVVNLYNGQQENVLSIWDNGTPPYDKDEPEEYEFESIQLVLGDGITNSQGLKANMTITVLLPEITSVENLTDITVDFGTEKSDIDFPNEVEVELDNGSTRSLGVNWEQGDPNYDGETPGSHTFTGTIDVPDDVTNPSNLDAQITVTVLPLEITDVEDLADITVDFGTDHDDIGLPDQVEVELDNGSTRSLDVGWNQGNPSYNGETPGSHTFTGTIDVPDDVTSPSNLDAQITVTVLPLEIVDVEDLTDISVDFGTDYNDIGLPSQVEVELDNGSTRSLDVDWDQGDPSYDGDTPGEYTFTGTLDVPGDVINPSNLDAQVKVTVLPLEIVDVEALTDITVDLGTDYDHIGLPDQVEVELDDGSKRQFDVDWDNGDPVYDENTPGEYAFTGSLNLPNEISNKDDLQAVVNVVLKPKSEINIPLDIETSIYSEQKGTIGGSDNFIIMPDELPIGTTVTITDASNSHAVLDAEGIERAGHIYDFKFKYPDDSDFEGTFTLTMAYENSFTTDIDIYYYNEHTGEWESQNGSIDSDNNTVTVLPAHFSIYGVFALTEDGESSESGSDNGEGEGNENNGTNDTKLSKDTKEELDSDDNGKDTDGETLPKTSTQYYTIIFSGLILITLGIVTFVLIRWKRFG